MVDLSRLLLNREIPVIMGILNATPDSFSNRGVAADLSQAMKMLDDGADILDIGGESTRPGAAELDWQDELNRVLPLVKAIKKACPSAVLSVDTRKCEVAEAVLAEGVEIINDVSNLRYSENMAQIVASYNAALVLMHSRGVPSDMAKLCEYSDLVGEVADELRQSVQKALACGVQKQNIWIDPGLGFAKNEAQNFELLKAIKDLKNIAPVLIGHSRKKFIRNFLGVDVEHADFGTAAVAIYAMEQGGEILRVHDVKNVKDVLKIYRRCCHG